jgi:hypothetical protein
MTRTPTSSLALCALLLSLAACATADGSADEFLYSDAIDAKGEASTGTAPTAPAESTKPSTGPADTRVYPIYSLWYRDADGDGYGNPFIFRKSIGQPLGYVKDATDCDDSLASVHPGAEERCNGVDDNCDGGSELEASFGGHDYLFCYLLEVEADYLSARGLCQANEGMDLVIVNSAEEQAFLTATWDGIRYDADPVINHRNHPEFVAWIGADDLLVNHTWRWVNGTPLAGGYTDWCVGEPNDAGGEDCAVTGWTSDYDLGPTCADGWNDLSCEIEAPFICESGF